MNTDTGRFAVFRQLKADGLTDIFGNPGTSEQNLMDLLRLEEFAAFRYYLGLHEGSAVAMADAYARYRQRPAIVQLHSYAGLANGLGMMYYARRGYTPMVVLVGEAGLRYEAMDAQMSADLVTMAKPFVKSDQNGPCAWRAVDEGSILRLLRRAIKCAGTPPFGPTLLVLPMDVLERVCPEEVIPTSFPDTQIAPGATAIAKAAELLQGARNPLILMGDGIAAAGAQTEMAELAELLGATVYGANNSEVNMASDQPLYGGDTGHMFGSHSKTQLESGDVVLICGTTVLPEVFPLIEGPFARDARLIHFDLNSAEIGKNFPTAVSAIGNPKFVFAALSQSIRASQTAEQRRAAEQRNRAAAEQKSDLARTAKNDSGGGSGTSLRASQFLKPLSERLSKDGIETLIFDEALTNSPVVTRYFPPTRCQSYFQTRVGMLGTGLPGTVGLKAAAPEKRVIGFVGDGGSISSIQALNTAARFKLGAKFVVCNNRSYQILKLNIQEYWTDWLRQPADQPFPDAFDLRQSGLRFDLLAKGQGVDAVRVEKEADIAPAIEAMLANDDPFLVDLVID